MKCLLCQSEVQISESFHIPWFPFGTEHPLFELAGTTVHRKCMEQNPEVRSLVELLVKRVPWVCTICHGKLDPWFEQSVAETAKVPAVMKNRIRFSELELVCVPSQIALPNVPSSKNWLVVAQAHPQSDTRASRLNFLSDTLERKGYSAGSVAR